MQIQLILKDNEQPNELTGAGYQDMHQNLCTDIPIAPVGSIVKPYINSKRRLNCHWKITTYQLTKKLYPNIDLKRLKDLINLQKAFLGYHCYSEKTK